MPYDAMTNLFSSLSNKISLRCCLRDAGAGGCGWDQPSHSQVKYSDSLGASTKEYQTLHSDEGLSSLIGNSDEGSRDYETAIALIRHSKLWRLLSQEVWSTSLQTQSGNHVRESAFFHHCLICTTQEWNICRYLNVSQRLLTQKTTFLAAWPEKIKERLIKIISTISYGEGSGLDSGLPHRTMGWWDSKSPPQREWTV